MTKWNDPATLETQNLYFVKLLQFAGGVYIWEIVTHLKYDWNLIIRPRDGPPWVKWTYLMCRYFALASVMALLTGFDVSTEVNCKTWVILTWIISFPAVQSSSVLMAIRVIAIWGYNKLFIALVASILCVQAGCYIYETTKVDAAWDSEEHSCGILNSKTTRLSITMTLGVDIFLLCSILIGLSRWKSVGQFGLWKFLWNQGTIWLTLAAIAEVPTVVLVWLNYNQAVNLMFFEPELVILAISAARMYRSLAEYTKSYKPHVNVVNDRNEPGMHNNLGTASLSNSDRSSIPMQEMAGRRHRLTHKVDRYFNKVSTYSVAPVQVCVHRVYE